MTVRENLLGNYFIDIFTNLFYRYEDLLYKYADFLSKGNFPSIWHVYSDVINKRVQISHTKTYSSNTTDGCHELNRNWVPFRHNCGHPRLLVGFDL